PCSVKFHSPARSITTASVALPVLPSLVAVITTVSDRARPVTRPVGETGACVGALLVQLTRAPGTSWPAASFTFAESCSVWPITTPAVAGVTSTRAGDGGGTQHSLPQALSRA